MQIENIHLPFLINYVLYVLVPLASVLIMVVAIKKSYIKNFFLLTNPVWITALIILALLGLFLWQYNLNKIITNDTLGAATDGESLIDTGPPVIEPNKPPWLAFRDEYKLWDYRKFNYDSGNNQLAPRSGSDLYSLMTHRKPVSIQDTVHLKFGITDKRPSDEKPLKFVSTIRSDALKEDIKVEVPFDGSTVVNITGEKGQDLLVPIDLNKKVDMTIEPAIYKNRITYQIILDYFPIGANFSQPAYLQPFDVFVDDVSIESASVDIAVGVYMSGVIKDLEYYFE